MKGQITPYLMFDGNAREALEFYREVFQGEILNVQTYGESGYNNSPEAENLLIHAQFKKDDLFIMASDAFPGNVINKGNNISLALDLESEEEIKRLYDALRENGKVYMELQDTFWGAKYAKVTDPFGIAWI
ncbi:VOC family protein [Bacillus salipaludis]|uniref:VOC family protein n=1 Tax=Bacillus salipaludis TaxID=2547811 RepID=A0AA90R8I1_9BACI|nr:VOC family protein [Bacillus salipaludis]MDQ6598353.1 VOC family protein [Bacillus salipaludis]